jgi:hypothetical protein
MAAKRRRGRGEGAVFFSESKQTWVARAVVGRKPNGSPKSLSGLPRRGLKSRNPGGNPDRL